MLDFSRIAQNNVIIVVASRPYRRMSMKNKENKPKQDPSNELKPTSDDPELKALEEEKIKLIQQQAVLDASIASKLKELSACESNLGSGATTLLDNLHEMRLAGAQAGTRAMQRRLLDATLERNAIATLLKTLCVNSGALDEKTKVVVDPPLPPILEIDKTVSPSKSDPSTPQATIPPKPPDEPIVNVPPPQELPKPKTPPPEIEEKPPLKVMSDPDIKPPTKVAPIKISTIKTITPYKSTDPGSWWNYTPYHFSWSRLKRARNAHHLLYRAFLRIKRHNWKERMRKKKSPDYEPKYKIVPPPPERPKWYLAAIQHYKKNEEWYKQELIRRLKLKREAEERKRKQEAEKKRKQNMNKGRKSGGKR